MKKGVAIGIMVGACLLAGALPITASAGKGKGCGNMKGSTLQTQTQTQTQTRQRLRDGSCISNTGNQTGAKTKQGNTYGPGDGTGNSGVGPKDGSGYGAPSQR